MEDGYVVWWVQFLPVLKIGSSGKEREIYGVTQPPCSSAYCTSLWIWRQCYDLRLWCCCNWIGLDWATLCAQRMRSTDYLNNTEQQVIPLIIFSFPDDRVIFLDANARTQIVIDWFSTRSRGEKLEHCMEMNLKHCRSLSRQCHSKYVP